MRDRIVKAQITAQVWHRRLAEAARSSVRDDRGEILPWVLLTVGLLAVVALIVAAINTWAKKKSGDITSH